MQIASAKIDNSKKHLRYTVGLIALNNVIFLVQSKVTPSLWDRDFSFRCRVSMTSRVYHVCPDKDKFRIQLRTIYAKASTRMLVELRGYPCANSANNDVTRLKKFFHSENSRITGFAQSYTAISNCRNFAVKADYAKTVEEGKGVVRKNQQIKMSKEYDSYKTIMI
jgi:hypothetical protein